MIRPGVQRASSLRPLRDWRASLVLLALVCLGTSASEPIEYKWSSIRLRVSGMPADAEYVPISARVQFGQRNIDERSIRLFSVKGNDEEEIPCQFTPVPQVRSSKRNLLPGTTPQVSYVTELPSDETAPFEIAGDLTWIASSKAGEYLVRFGVPRHSRLVQVPYAPWNLRTFDEQGYAVPVRWFPRMQVHPQWPFEGKVDLFDGTELVTCYHLGPLPGATNGPFRRPFFYPVNGPDGIGLTEFGKPHDPTGSHAHHYSLWVAHNSVNGNDFWSENGGVISHDQLAAQEDGPIFCRIAQKTRWRAKNTELLRETRRITLYRSAENFRVIDLDLEFTPAGSDPVTFGKTSFGFLAARVAQSMTVFDGAGEIRNSKGDLNEAGAHLKHADWIDQSGPITADQWGGIAIFDSPSNPNHPCGWHCRNDGWAGASFNLDSPYTLEPGAKLNLSYRILLHRGNAVTGEVARRYTEYAAAPTVKISAITEE